mmetsp:Transcript_98713/g.287947  ORF Transcript_98713/g.287947 Transcript_98713/m.287947 type:complete len:103 (-) Transcript_98713:475-783(-)
MWDILLLPLVQERPHAVAWTPNLADAAAMPIDAAVFLHLQLGQHNELDALDAVWETCNVLHPSVAQTANRMDTGAVRPHGCPAALVYQQSADRVGMRCAYTG